jgi:hypothetical protein
MQVLLAEERATGALYAVKILRKDFVIENDELSRHAPPQPRAPQSDRACICVTR